MSSTESTVPSSAVITRWALNCGRTERNWISFPDVAERVHHPVEGRVREAVAVGREELLVVVQVLLDRLQPLADRRLHAGVDEGDPPVSDVAVQELYPGVGPVPLEHEVVEQGFVVVEEVLADHVALVAEAEHELGVPPCREVAHDVPEDRPVADPDHRLRDPLGLLPHPHPEAAAEDDDLHGTPPPAVFGKLSPARNIVALGTGTTSRAPHSAV